MRTRIKMKRRKFTRLSFLVAITAIMTAGFFSVTAYADTSGKADTSILNNLESFSEGSYGAYLISTIGNSKPGSGEIAINAADYTSANMAGIATVSNYEGMAGKSLKTTDNGTVTWTVQVPANGWYNIQTTYFPLEGKKSGIAREIQIDGAAPYSEAKNVAFDRIWKDSIACGKSLDDAGNEIRSTQIEAPQWRTVYLKDPSGFYSDPLKFYFTAGTHTLTFSSVKEPMMINRIVLKKAETSVTYAQALAKWKAEGITKVSNVNVKVQAESIYNKSDMSIYPINDRTSAISENSDGSLYDYSRTTLNSIGGDKWKIANQWVSWKVNVPKEGLYKLVIREKQDTLQGLSVGRSIMINGEAQYAEAKALSFKYSNSYQIYVPSDDNGNEYLFYFKKGENSITMQAVLADTEPVARVAQSSITILNECYRKIMMITGTSPDVDRDYHFADMLPDVVKQIKNQAQILYSLSAKLYEINGARDSNQATLDSIADRLMRMYNRPDLLADYFSAFKADLGTLSTWVNTIASVPLQLDYIEVASTDSKLPKADAGLFTGVMHEIRLFISSFTTDYTNVGGTSKKGDKTITVWFGGTTNAGLEQAKVLKQMISDSFTPKTGIKVNLQFISMAALLPATLAGRAPDVAMQIAGAEPVNYAMRDAVYDLSKFPDYKQVTKRFANSATVQFEYNGGVYALPETMVFPVLFYRKDIMNELGLSLPKTWDDVYAMLPDLQKKYMNFGYPPAGIGSADAFGLFLFQNNGTFYKNDNMRSNLDSPESVKAFTQWTDLYLTYQFDKVINFMNRFRRGELPIAVYSYTGYNELVISAPEIKGLWGFAPVPGQYNKDGTINNTVACTVTGCIMLNQSKHKNDAWEYMKWWTDADTQLRFSQEVEAIMGTAARFPTANVEALQKLSWTSADLKVLMNQLDHTEGIPQVPGGYYTPRYVYNAYLKAVINNEDQREVLLDFVKNINEELYSRRKEYGLSTMPLPTDNNSK